MTKICTTIEQSKRLMELGLDRKTSDMYYWCGSALRIGGYRAQDEELDVPAWSLSALLKILPFPSLHEIANGWRCDCCGKDGWGFRYGDREDEPLDAAFERVCWALENNDI